MSTIAGGVAAEERGDLSAVLATLIVDRSSPVPLYFQVAQHIETAIEAGAVNASTRIDNEIQLAEQLGLSRPTMRQALQYLVDKGLLIRRRGIGTRVVQPKVRRPVELTSLYDDLNRTDQRPTTTLLSLEQQPAPSLVAKALALPTGSTVTRIERLRLAREVPIAKMTNFLPSDVIDFDGAQLESTGLYQLLRMHGITLRSAIESIGARVATAAEAKLLMETRGAALLTMQRTAYDETGRAVEYGDHLYAASRYSFELSLLIG
jgi:DNA-binding GntR family transcriptional regulator